MNSLRHPKSSLTIIAIAGLASCGEWPRFKHLSTDDGGTSSAIDPREIVAVGDYVVVEEQEDNGSPLVAQAIRLSLDSERAYEFRGVLEGIGWSDVAPPTTFESPPCDVSYTVSLDEPGNYVEDVDFYIVEIEDDGLLCARVTTDQVYGWDLLAYQLDECLVPSDMLADSEGLLGYGLGAANGWGVAVSAGDTIALGLGGYAPNLAELAPTYSLGVTLLRSSGEGFTICPLNPGE